jgi:hypothetical protein
MKSFAGLAAVSRGATLSARAPASPAGAPGPPAAGEADSVERKAGF